MRDELHVALWSGEGLESGWRALLPITHAEVGRLSSHGYLRTLLLGTYFLDVFLKALDELISRQFTALQ
jgi:hypothetical protein